MLKWTVMTRRDGDDEKNNETRHLYDADKSTPRRRQKTKRRRSGYDDKENQFTSTPIKSSDNCFAFDALRDVSNLTPTDADRRRFSGKKAKSAKKKKNCVAVHDPVSDSQCSNFFRSFEAVDSHIESVLCSCKKTPIKEDRPPSKKFKTSLVEDFFDQISLLATTDDVVLPGLRLNSNTKNLFDRPPAVSPLVRQFLDLKFAQDDAEDSSFINDMSLEKIVDAILEKSHRNPDKDPQEENSSENGSSDSGFRSTTNENSHHRLDGNFQCECNKKSPALEDKTIIQLDDVFNERCVDERPRKRRSSSTDDHCGSLPKKQLLDDEETVKNFTLKRQKCIRRRKPEDEQKKLWKMDGCAKTISPFWSCNKKFASDDSLSTSCEKTPLRGCYLENKDLPQLNPSNGRTIRRCLLFESPDKNVCDSFEAKGSIDLKMSIKEETLYVHVIRCKDLFRVNGEKINAYVKVALCDRPDGGRRKRNAVLQRTAVQGESCRPQFHHTFKFANVHSSLHKRVVVEVWHRDRTTKTSEFLGCMSADVKDVFSKDINGSFQLLPQTARRSTITTQPEEGLTKLVEMCESRGSVDEVMSLDELDNELKKCTSKSALNEQQKHADENLFLRYLELDPTEGPDAIPAATQRKATGNKCGRTPFTQTKKLTRPAKSGFGFSVVWTHPPRIERVEKGLPADKAGILPGDYLIFVDKYNVVMMPEIDILNLIRSYGSQLTLEIFRRNQSRNGSLPSVKPASTATKTDSNLNLPGSTAGTTQRRPSTVCSINTTSMEMARRKLQLPQVTFSAEVGNGVIV